MDSKGIILKQDVDQIWRNKKYSKFRKEKDYLLAVMTHLDILVEPIYCENCRFMEQHIFIGFSIGLHPPYA
jgi:hypothetical protein